MRGAVLLQFPTGLADDLAGNGERMQLEVRGHGVVPPVEEAEERTMATISTISPSSK
jgi:hypothetical protein